MLNQSSTTTTTDLFPIQHRLRSSSENESISSSSSRSESSLSDPVARSSTISSNASFDEDLDFSLGFDQITDEDDDDEKQRTSKLLDEPTLDEYFRQSSNSTIINHDSSLDNDQTISTNYMKRLQRPNFLHDSTYTLCSPDRFSAYTDDDDHNADEETPEEEEQQRVGIGMRSNSLSILPENNKVQFIDKTPKKVVRFADVMGLDLESIRYMTPPDHSSTTLIQDCLRLQLGQLRLAKNTSDMSSLFNRSTLPSPTKQYNLVSKNFISPTDVIPLIYEQHVMLECLYTKDSVAYGTIRVHNCAYDKNVFIRLTENEWNTTNDIQAWHSMNYPQDNTDTFTVEIILPKLLEETLSPKRILFAVCLQAMEGEFWDNNQGWNYVLDVFQKR